MAQALFNGLSGNADGLERGQKLFSGFGDVADLSMLRLFAFGHGVFYDVAGDDFQNGGTYPALGLVRHEFVNVPFVREVVAALLGVTAVPDGELTNRLGVGFQVPGVGLAFAFARAA